MEIPRQVDRVEWLNDERFKDRRARLEHTSGIEQPDHDGQSTFISGVMDLLQGASVAATAS
jgi:hypothetical protein